MKGSISSLVLDEMKSQKINSDNDLDNPVKQKALIEVHGRDFLASLSRVIQIND